MAHTDRSAVMEAKGMNGTNMIKLYAAAYEATSKTERDEAVKQLMGAGYCSHYAGYTCDRNFPDACMNCIKWTINLHKARKIRQQKGQ